MIEPAVATVAPIPQGIAPVSPTMSLSRLFDLVVFWGFLAIGISVPLLAAVYATLFR